MSFRPKVESLEERLAFDASGLDIWAEFGTVTPGLDPDEFTVAGAANGVTNATAYARDDGSHVFIYAEQIGQQVRLSARHTTALGNPGGALEVLLTVDLTTGFGPNDLQFSATSAPNDSFVLAWNDSTGIHAQLFASDFSPQSAAVTIAGPPAAGSPYLNSTEILALNVLALSDGDVAIAYTNPNSATVNIVGLSQSLAGTTGLTWEDTDPPGSDESLPFDLALQELADESLLLTWKTVSQSTPEDWRIHTVTFVNEQFTGINEWIANGFMDAPQTAYQSDGDLVFSGIRESGGELETLIRVYDSNNILLKEEVLPPGLALSVGIGGLAVSGDDSFAVGILDSSTSAPSFLWQSFTESGELIGSTLPLNQTELYTQFDGGVYGLPTGGFAGYWLGYALDGITAAIFSRTIEFESTKLEIDFDSSLTTGDPSAFVVVDGLPSDVGLNVGVRASDSSWLVPVSQLPELELLSFGEHDAVQLSLQLFSGSGVDLTDQSYSSLGSDGDDQFLPSNYVSGGLGFDILNLTGEASSYSIDDVGLGRYRLIAEGEAHDIVFSDIENFDFADASYSLAELLEVLAESGSESSTDGAAPPAMPVAPPWAIVPPPAMPPPQQVQPPGGILGGGEKTMVGPVRPPLESGDNSEAGARDTKAKDERVVGKKNPNDHKQNERARKKDAAKNPGDKGDASEGRESFHVSAENSAAVPEINAHPKTGLDQPEAGQPANSSDLSGGQGGVSLPPQGNQHATNTRTSPPAFRSLTHPPAPLVNRVAPAVPLFPTEALSNAPAFDSEQLFAEMDDVKQEISTQVHPTTVLVGSAMVVATGFSVAHIAWLLRGSALLAKLMTSMPIWVSFDPLVVLDQVQPTVAPLDPQQATLQNESLLDIVETPQ